MRRRVEINHGPKTTLNAQEAEELFSTVDNSGHVNKDSAEQQRKHRKLYGHGVDVDPLTSDDPSGSSVGPRMKRAAVVLLVVFIGAIIFIQLYVSHKRGENTANLSGHATVRTVADALEGGVEWGGGFTQFPQEFSVQEVDENTGRIEVTVVDTISQNALLCFSNAQIQATAFSVTSLLNPNIDTVIYHVNVHVDENGNLQSQSYFGFFQPAGDLVPFMTFIWTKNTTAGGQVRFYCTITGVDPDLQDILRNQILGQEPEAEVEVEVDGTGTDDADDAEGTEGAAKSDAAADGSSDGNDAGTADGTSSADGAEDATNDADKTDKEAPSVAGIVENETA